MRLPRFEKPGWVLQPAVTLTLAYGGVILCYFLYLASTLTYPSIFERGPQPMIEARAYWTLTGANLMLALASLASLAAARRSGPSARRGQLVGILASLGLLAVLQFGAQVLQRDMRRVDTLSPQRIEAFLEQRAPDERVVLDAIRDALKSAHPDALEALWQEALVYQVEGDLVQRLRVVRGAVLLNLYRRFAQPPELEPGPWSLEIDSRSRSALLVIPCPLDDDQLQRLRGVVLDLDRSQ